MLRISRILVPVDFSEHAREALAYAHALAVPHGARLDLLHVIEDSAFPAFYDLGAQALYGHVPDLAARAQEALGQLADETAGGGPDARCHVRRGRAPAEVITFAEAETADLIVIASHGLTGLKRLVMGSVAERIVREAPCPVFVVKSFGRSLLEEHSPG